MIHAWAAWFGSPEPTDCCEFVCGTLGYAASVYCGDISSSPLSYPTAGLRTCELGAAIGKVLGMGLHASKHACWSV